MEDNYLYYQKVREGACTPTRDTEDSVGYDLKAPFSQVIEAETTGVIPIGLAFDIPKGQYGRLATKSQQAWQYSLLVLGGVIDPGYTREVFVILHVLGKKDFEVEKGKDFIQLVLEKNNTPTLKEVKRLPQSTKKTKTYGHPTQKLTKRLESTKSSIKTLPQKPKKYKLRKRGSGKFTSKSICKHCQ